MHGYRRYAIFYAPPSGSMLETFGEAWLGWSAAKSKALSHHPALDFDIEAATATPRRYGFHGTLKPPFALAKGTDVTSLAQAVARLAARFAPFECAPLQVQHLGRFLALCPTTPSAALATLAAACVQDIDPHRAPPPPEDLARRRARGLTARQETYLTRWGYPYVLEEFRFHLTLTGALDDGTAARATHAAERLAAPALDGPFRVGEICLFGEDAERRFHLLQRFALGVA